MKKRELRAEIEALKKRVAEIETRPGITYLPVNTFDLRGFTEVASGCICPTDGSVVTFLVCPVHSSTHC